MGYTKFQIIIIVIFVVAGTMNTISLKWQDELEAINSVGKLQKFHHPFIQTLCMFMGMLICLFAFYSLYYYYKFKDGSQDVQILTKGNQNFNKFVFVFPTMLDLCGTGLSYVGLNMTCASSFQMLRGSVIIFVGILSMIFLKRKITIHQWIGMITVTIGLVVVGVADFVSEDTDSSDSVTSIDSCQPKHQTKDVLIGDLLIVFAQCFTAVQYIVEEKLTAGKDIPGLLAMGLEGLFGGVILSILLIPMYFIYIGKPFSDNPNGSIEDAIDAGFQYYNNGLIILASFFTFTSTTFFNWSGIQVTKELSATTCVVSDSIRTIFIKILTLLLFNQKFNWIQLIGFIILIAGIFIYNNIQFWLVPCKIRDYHQQNQQGEQQIQAEEAEKKDPRKNAEEETVGIKG